MRTNAVVHRIVVLDADQGAAMRICFLLRGMGHFVLLAADVKEALDLVRTERADCMLIDLDLPGEAALGLCREVRREEPGRKVVAFALASERGVGQKRAAEAGYDGWLVRPLRYDEARLLFGDLRPRPAES